jgi:hypothetical protein
MGVLISCLKTNLMRNFGTLLEYVILYNNNKAEAEKLKSRQNIKYNYHEKLPI